MSFPNDYQGEMRRELGLSDHEIDRLFAGNPVDGAGDLAGFVHVARYAVMEAPSEELAARHIAQISEAARLLDKAAPALDKAAPALLDKAAPRPRKVHALMDKALRMAFKVSAGVVALFTSMMGLAYAGVDLPGTAAERAAEAVLGVHIPNQNDEAEDESSVDGEENGKSVSDDVHATQDSFGDTRGCEFGQAVSEAASQNSQGDGGSDKEKCAGGPDAEHTNSGQGAEKSETAKAAGKAKGDAAKQEGQAHKDDASNDNAPNDNATNDTAPNGSAATGDEHSTDAGAESKPEKPDAPPGGDSVELPTSVGNGNGNGPKNN